MAVNKKTSFMMNVITIVVAQILVKLLGFAYRMVITNIEGFGDLGNGYYNFGFQIYTLLLALSSVGIPNAIAKLVAERSAVGDHRGAMRIFRTALLLFSVIGGLFSLLLFFGADFIAGVVLRVPGAVYTLRALSPSIFFVSVSSVIRGYFGGLQNMRATASAQVLEQFLKSLLTILVVVAMTGQAPEYMAAGANLATTVSTVLSFMYLWGFYGAHRGEIKARLKQSAVCKKQGFLQLSKIILMVSIPISLSSIVTALNRVLDSVTVVRGIEKAFSALFSDPAALNSEAVRLSGILSKTDVLINLPLALNIALSTALVPAVAGAVASGKSGAAARRVSFSVLISVIVAFPAAAGYIALAQPILNLIYPNANQGALIFAISSVTIVFTAVCQTLYGALQGLGRVFVPALSLLAGGAVKLVINLTLIPIPQINIFGAPIGSVVCQAIAFLISFAALRKSIRITFGFSKYILKPLTATAIMFGAVRLVLGLSQTGLSQNIATVAAILIGGAVYIVMILALNIFDEEDFLMLPFGRHIARFASFFTR